tara:strand:+ start:6174 stop:7190 length:1017 start_codon:yes stop_codon:yes gene_type:complete
MINLLSSFFYLLPRGILPHSFLYIPAIIFLFLNFNKVKINAINLILFLVSVGLFLLFQDLDYILIATIHMYFCCIDHKEFKISIFNNLGIYLNFGFLILLWFQSGGARVGYYTDPNFGGLIFSFLIILQAIRKPFSILNIVLFLGVLLATGSRLFLLFYFFVIISKYIPRIFMPKRRIIFSIILLNIGIIIFSYLAVNYASFSVLSSSGFERLTNLFDPSNLGRFNANIFWTEEVLFNWAAFTQNNLEVYDSTQSRLFNYILPHNSLLYLVISKDIFLSGYTLWTFSEICKKYYCDINSSRILLSYIIVGLFIHGVFSPIFLFSFAVIYSTYKLGYEK